MRDCCSNPDNLTLVTSERVDTVVRVCQKCSARHVEITVDPGELGLYPEPVG